MTPYRMLFLAVAATLLARMASAQKADVIHFYTSSGDSLAIGVFAKEYNKRGRNLAGRSGGGTAGGIGAGDESHCRRQSARRDAMAGRCADARTLRAGNADTLDDLAAAGNWAKNLPPIILSNVMFDGHFVTAPVDIHGANWMFYSTKVFKAVNLEPPKTWDEFFAKAPKLQAAGYIPLAYGANAQQEGWLFMALLAGIAGSETYLAVAVQHDPKAAGSEGVRKVFETMGKLRQYVDAGSPNRKWNDTLALVETNKAALMIVGDWAKGDLAAANLKIDEDWGCALAPGSQDAYIMNLRFCIPEDNKPEQIAAQRKLADVFMDPAVQVEFNKYKGSLPSRLDADVESLDACAQLGQKVMAGGDANQLPNFALAFGPNTQGQIEDLLIHYWSTPGMSAADATKEFSTIIANAGT